MSRIDFKLVIALARTQNCLVSHTEESLKPYKLSISEFGVLEFLLHKGRHPVQIIAERILVTSGTMTYVIDKLIKRGLVTKEKCSVDQRKYYIELTDEGTKLIKEVFGIHEKQLNILFSDLDVEEKQQLVRSLIKLKESMKEE